MPFSEIDRKIEITPQKELEKNFSGIRDFMFKTHHGYWQYRFATDTPYMKESFDCNKRESVSSHMHSVALLWSLYEKACPNLSEAVDANRTLRILIKHDLGEMLNGDMSIITQLTNHVDRREVERQDLIKLSETLPDVLKKDLLEAYDSFEFDKAEIKNIDDADALLAKVIDTIAGDYFVMNVGNDLFEHRYQNANVIKIRLEGCARQLLQVLMQSGKIEAAEELRLMVEYHLKAWKEKGVEAEINLNI
jgi:5'-deoxynucleotidase YfbR-like HD superfamily hydrolase